MAITNRQRGGALLAVLWLSAALSAIAFSLANTVRGEVERTSTAVDGLRAYYLAQGGIERGILYIQWGLGGQVPPDSPLRYAPSNPVLAFPFPGGEAIVEVVPETAKMNINNSVPEDLFRLIVALGVPPPRAQGIVGAIIAWRSAGGLPSSSPFFVQMAPSFPAHHASFEETEELLLLPGMTPDLYYGGYDRDADGRLVPHGGLRDCLSIFGATDRFDVNTAQPAVLAAIGLPSDAVGAIVARRRIHAFQSPQELGNFVSGGGQAFARLRVGGNSIFTLRSTARIRSANGQLSDLRRTVAAMVKIMPTGYDAPVHVLRWYDNAWTP